MGGMADDAEAAQAGGRPPDASDARRDLRLTGLLATAVALTGLWVASHIYAGVSFPPAALADALIRVTPGDLVTFFIDLLKHWAMRLLILAALAGTLAVGAEALRITARGARPRPWLAGALLGVLGAVAALLQPAPRPDALVTGVALLIAAAAYAGVASVVHLALTTAPTPDEGRRRALRLGLSSAGALAASGLVGGWLIGRLAGPRTDVHLAAAAHPATVVPDDSWPDIPGMVQEVTSAADHYVVDINFLPPAVSADGWRLDVTGAVAKTGSYSFTELQQAFEVVEEHSVLTCVSNEVGGDLVGSSLWGGVRLADLLDAAGVGDAAADVVFTAADGYSDSIPIELARDPSVLLAVSQNRAPLRQEHGFPCRLRVPAIYGMKNVKWLSSIEVVTSDYLGYWQKRGWSDDAEVRTESRIVVAGEDGSAARGQDTWVAGVAWAGLRGISKVEVSLDGGGSWSEAMLKKPVAPYAWRLWAHRWRPAETGTALVVARATDGAGRVQTSRQAPPHPAGATGYPSVEVNVA